MNTVRVSSIPPCDLCPMIGREVGDAKYDGATLMGPWGYMCESCFGRFGVGLGLGVGQELVLATVEPLPVPKPLARDEIAMALGLTTEEVEQVLGL